MCRCWLRGAHRESELDVAAAPQRSWRGCLGAHRGTRKLGTFTCRRCWCGPHGCHGGDRGTSFTCRGCWSWRGRGNRGGYRGPVNSAVSHLDIAAGVGVGALGPTRGPGNWVVWAETGQFQPSGQQQDPEVGRAHDAQSGLGQPASACIMFRLACSTCSTVMEPLLSESTHV